MCFIRPSYWQLYSGLLILNALHWPYNQYRLYSSLICKGLPSHPCVSLCFSTSRLGKVSIAGEKSLHFVVIFIFYCKPYVTKHFLFCSPQGKQPYLLHLLSLYKVFCPELVTLSLNSRIKVRPPSHLPHGLFFCPPSCFRSSIFFPMSFFLLRRVSGTTTDHGNWR